MAEQPEQEARREIDRLLTAAGWAVQSVGEANIHAARGVAIREFPLKTGHGYADYLLYIDGKAAGVIEAKKVGTTLTGVEVQSNRYALGLPDALPAWVRPLPFSYESTGVETRFTNGLDPEPRSRATFAFHKPDMLAEWLRLAPSPAPAGEGGGGGVTTAADGTQALYVPTFLARMKALPPLIETGLWPAQVRAIRNLEVSLAADKPRALIQMATGSLTKNPKRQQYPRKLPYLRVANVYANELRLAEIEHIGVLDGEIEKLLLRRGDMLVVEGNGSPDQIGRVALWDESINDCVHQNHLIKVRFSTEVVPEWALVWLLSPGGRHEIEQVSSSTAGLHTLSTGKVRRLPLPLPPLDDQRRILAEVDRRLSLIRGVEAEVDANLKRAGVLHQSTLTAAFAG